MLHSFPSALVPVEKLNKPGISATGFYLAVHTIKICTGSYMPHRMKIVGTYMISIRCNRVLHQLQLRGSENLEGKIRYWVA